MAESRVDPVDGLAYTFEEIEHHYEGKFKKAAIKAYWNEECLPGKATAKAQPKSKAKSKLDSQAAIDERRVDPYDGGEYTFEEMKKQYQGQFKMALLKTYWYDECTQVDSKNSAKGKTTKGMRPQKAKEVKEVAKMKSVESTGGPTGDSEAKDKRKAAPKKSNSSVWSEYDKIANISDKKTLTDLRKMAAGTGSEWIATEKVHGSNFCFETDGEKVEYASRSKKLDADADFFNFKETMPKYHPFALQAFRLAKHVCPDLQRLLIYGEYFGGWYPGAENLPEREKGLKKVQGGIAYSPGHHFLAFDASLDGKRYLDFDEFRELMLSAGFPLVATPLKRGTLEELLAIDVETLQTGVPDMLGHPALDQHRIAEGVVIRRAKEFPEGMSRGTLKMKARAFWEATNQFQTGAHQAEKAAASLAAFNVDNVSDPVAALVEAALTLVTENRLRAVISKSPDLLQKKEEQNLVSLFSQDVLKDFEKCHQAQVLTRKEDTDLKHMMGVHSRRFVKERMPDIRADVG